MTKCVKLAALFLTCCLLCGLVGCSNNVKVTGVVNYEDGTPVKEGEIYLEGSVLGRATIKDGSFALGLKKDGEGVPPGTYKVQCSKALPELKADPNIEAYELIEPTEVTVEKKALKLEVHVRKLTSDGPAAGEIFEKAWEDKSAE